MNNLLSIENLNIKFKSKKTYTKVVTDVSFDIKKGEILGLVGESGCGKTITSLSIPGLLPKDAIVENGKIIFDGHNIMDFNEKELTEIRGNRISFIFQEPSTSLNPLMTVGNQILENIVIHKKISKEEAKKSVISLMKKVGLSDTENMYKKYPHELSGGQKQRIVIAAAVSCNPALIIADEPTTALDVTIQAGILELLKELNAEYGSSILFISHDLALVNQMCDRIIVMYAGFIIEFSEAENIISSPLHPYTNGLIKSIPTESKKGKKLYSVEGRVSHLRENEKKCPFASRCTIAQDICFKSVPELRELIPGHFVRCFLAKGDKNG